MSIRDLLGNEVFADAVLAFLRDTRVGMVREGALDKDWNVHNHPLFSSTMYLVTDVSGVVFLVVQGGAGAVISPKYKITRLQANK